MALSWVLKDGDVTSVLIGASRPSQIEENLGIVEKTAFAAEELNAIDRICGL
jgi:L-glyceraldehyde 3-phosphate reductase